MKKTLLNPFEKYTERQLFAAGIIMTIAGAYAAYYFKVRLNSIIDFHPAPNAKIRQSFGDSLINLTLLSVILYILGKIINKKTRLIDIVNAALISRVPWYLLILINFASTSDNITNKINPEKPLDTHFTTLELTILFLFGVCSLLVLMWFILLLYNGFRVATNAKTNAHKIFFGIAFLITVILSTFFNH